MSERPFVPIVFPAWVVWGQRAGCSITREQWERRGPNGRGLCGWCGIEVAGRRTRWCSDRCVARYARVWNWAAVARYVLERDGGRCRRCGTDHPGPPPTRVRTHAWDVDHIRPVRDGGTDYPDNLRLLCHACHKAVGYEQRGKQVPPRQLSFAESGAALRALGEPRGG